MANKDKFLNQLSDILLCVLGLESFILLTVRSLLIDDTGIVIAPIRSLTIVGNDYCNDETSKYKSTIILLDSDIV